MLPSRIPDQAGRASRRWAPVNLTACLSRCGSRPSPSKIRPRRRRGLAPPAARHAETVITMISDICRRGQVQI